MIAAPHESQVFESVIEGVVVDVVDDEALWDRAVGVFPDASVLELEDIAAGDVPSEHPVAVLDVAAWVLSSLALEVGAALLIAVDALVASVGGFAVSTTGAAHELQRDGSFTHASSLGRWPAVDGTRHAAMFSAPVPYLASFTISDVPNGLRAMTIGSKAGLSAARCFGKPDP